MIAITAITRLIILFSINVIKITEIPVTISPIFDFKLELDIIGIKQMVKPVKIINDFKTYSFFFCIINIIVLLNNDLVAHSASRAYKFNSSRFSLPTSFSIEYFHILLCLILCLSPNSKLLFPLL